MSTHWWDLTYSKNEIFGKDLFVFVNHKVAVICWAIIREKAGLCNVITFDSHRDYRDGVINRLGANASLSLAPEECCYSSKYYFSLHNRQFPHISTAKEFKSWNPLDEKQNNELITKQQKFFSPLNDNFIDVAFLKGIVQNVHCFYRETRNETYSGKCDDIQGEDHIFEMASIEDFNQHSPNSKFILDIDLDFFAKFDYESERPGWRTMTKVTMKKYMSLMRSLANQENCKGVTIALEPGCCGSYKNCLKICSIFSEVFDKDIVSISKILLKNRTSG